MPSPTINSATTFSAIPCFVPEGVLWYTLDTDLIYVGTGISNNGGNPGVVALGPNGGPIIQAKLQAVGATTAESITITAAGTVMYAVSVSMESDGSGGSGHIVTATLSWTSPIKSHSVTLDLELDSPGVVVETYPILCAASTSITLSTAYAGGATNDPYTISARLVEMP